MEPWQSLFAKRGNLQLPTIKFAMAFLLLFVGILVVPARAEKGESSYKQGKELEAQQNYEAAYEAYDRAYGANPKNTEFRAALTRMRFLAASAKVHRATLLQQAGQLEDALLLFQEAAKIDSSSPIASQQVINTRNMIRKASGIKAETPPESESKLNPDILDAQGPVKLRPLENLPITLKLSDDTKLVYRTIGELAGLNVLFDPDYTSRKVSIELSGVTLQEALNLVAAQSKTFWKPMTPDAIFVAADNPGKRKELEENVVKTFYLSNLTAPTELQDIVNTLRTVLDVTRVQQLLSQEAIVIRGTPDQVLLAEKMVNDFDRAAPEVVVDLAVMQVSRDKVHQIGLSPPTSATVQLQANTTTSSTSSTSSTTSTTSSSSTDGINLNTLANLNATDFTATISSASAAALFSDSHTKIVQNPQIRSLNGQKASIKIGDRVPTATGTSSSAVSGVSLTGLNTTQFQYIDVGVNVDVTPQIHADGDVTLKIVLDVSSVTSYQDIGGISEPVIGQRKVEHEIRLKDGEVSLLGGILQQQDTQSLSGIPGLSQIPILKYLFSQKKTEVSDTEIVFALIPHIVRRKDIDEFNTRTIDVGTANSVHLRHEPSTLNNSASADAPKTISSAEPPRETAAALELDPTVVSVVKGETFAVNVLLSGAKDVHSVPLQVEYDPNGLQLVNVSNGDFLSQGEQLVALVHREDASTGTLEVTASRPAKAKGVSGHGVVTTLTFQAKSAGSFPIRVSKGVVIQSGQQQAAVSGGETTVSVR
jgi:general secretion pathway protein D